MSNRNDLRKPIYLDYNATTPLAPEVVRAMKPYLDRHFGNPSSAHYYGFETRDAVIQARKDVAGLINCTPDEIIFTSCATESNNLAIQGVVFSRYPEKTHIITSAVEHSAVLEVCRFCKRFGVELTIVPVDGTGHVDPDDVANSIRPDTILISIMTANNEVGTIQPIGHISRIAREHGILMHTDAAQAVGKIPVDVSESGVDMLTIAGHKFYGPKGIGALYIRKDVKPVRILHGAGHEQGFRAGTENVSGIVGLGAACRLAQKHLPERVRLLKSHRDHLQDAIQSGYKNVRLNGHPVHRLPNTLSLSFLNFPATDILNEMVDVAVSPGAACHSSGAVQISHVLEAMQVPPEWALGTIRFSTGIQNTTREIDLAAQYALQALNALEDRS